MVAGLGEAIGSAVGGIAGLFMGGGGDEEAEKALQLWLNLQDPTFDFTQLTPAELHFVSQVDPQFYEAVIPEEVKLAQQGATRQDQMGSLAYLKDVQQTGLTEADRLQAQEAMNAIAREQGRGQQAVMRDLAMRGRMGPGHELAARQLAAQGDIGLQAEMGRGLALDAINRKYNAALDAADLAGQVRYQDESLSAYNANATNRFNELVSQMQTDAAKYAADTQNQTNLRNAEEQQRISDSNQLLAYENQLGNLNRYNQLQQQMYNNQLTQAAGATGQYNQLAGREDAGRSANVQNLATVGGAAGSLAEYLYTDPKKKKQQGVT